MRDLDLTSLRLFVAVCDARNISIGAERSNIVASAVSKRMTALEESLGVSLLTRRRRGVEPTPAGETLLEHARVMLARAQRMEQDMQSYAAGVKGQVRLLATASVLAESLAEDVASFLKKAKHRDIRVDMEEGVSTEVVRSVRDGMAAIGICWDAADFQGLQTLPYRTDHLAVVVHGAHPLAKLRAVSFEAALDYEHVSLSPASAVPTMLNREAALLGRTLSQRVVVSNFDAAIRVVRADLAISVIPQEVAQAYAGAGGVRVIPLTDAWAHRKFVLCVKGIEQLSTAARLLAEHLRSAAPAHSKLPVA